jgi:hypothetical protein
VVGAIDPILLGQIGAAADINPSSLDDRLPQSLFGERDRPYRKADRLFDAPAKRRLSKNNPAARL